MTVTWQELLSVVDNAHDGYLAHIARFHHPDFDSVAAQQMSASQFKNYVRRLLGVKNRPDEGRGDNER